MDLENGSTTSPMTLPTTKGSRSLGMVSKSLLVGWLVMYVREKAGRELCNSLLNKLLKGNALFISPLRGPYLSYLLSNRDSSLSPRLSQVSSQSHVLLFFFFVRNFRKICE